MWSGRRALALCAGLVLAGTLTAANAQDLPATLPEVALGSTEIYTQSLRALTILLVGAVLVENALAVLFNWRVFLTYFSLRGIKTPITFLVSLALVIWSDLDVVAALRNVYLTGTPSQSGPISTFLTALIVAGGSSGVHNLMASLGYRDRNREAQVNKRPAATEAWLAIRVTRKEAVGPIEVRLTQLDAAPAAPGAPAEPAAALVGTIGGRRPSLRELLMRNPDRFPQNSGFSVEPDVDYAIGLEARNGDKKMLKDPFKGRVFRFAPGAIVDLEADL